MRDPEEIEKDMALIKKMYGDVDPEIEHYKLVPDHPDTPDHYSLDADPRNNPNQPADDLQGDHHPGVHRHVANMGNADE